MSKKYDNVNTNKLMHALNDIFELNCEEFNNKYGTNILEIDYKDIDDFVVVRKSKTDYSLDYVELELSEITATIFAEICYNYFRKVNEKFVIYRCYNYIIKIIKEMITMITILNTSILTTTGTFRLDNITLDEAKNLVHNNEILSAVGHKSTADILTTLLEKEIPANRIEYAQNVNEKALVFKLNGRAEEGKILTADEIQEMGYKFQLLTKLSN